MDLPEAGSGSIFMVWLYSRSVTLLFIDEYNLFNSSYCSDCNNHLITIIHHFCDYLAIIFFSDPEIRKLIFPDLRGKREKGVCTVRTVCINCT